MNQSSKESSRIRTDLKLLCRIRAKESLFEDFKRSDDLYKFILKGTMEQLNDTERNETFDIVWVHHSAIQLEVTKLKPLES